MKKILLIVIGVILVLGAGGFWYYRDSIFSKEVLRVEILGPENVKAGDEVEYTVKYKNNGNFVLEQPKLTFELPEYSITEDGKTRFTQTLNDIYPGDEDFIKFKGTILGKQGDIKIARALLSYQPKNLSTRYEADTALTSTITSVPFTLTLDLPTRVEKAKQITYEVNYFSNIEYPLENLSIRVEKVPGFTLVSVDPSSLDNTEWKVGTLNKSEGGRITVKGTVDADAGQNLPFAVKLGMWQDGSFVVLKEVEQEVGVIQPLVFLSQQINGSSNYVASPGELLRYKVFLRNIGSTPFDNLFTTVRLNGSAFDFETIEAPRGEVRTQDGIIVFDPKEIPSLGRLDPQGETEVEFSVRIREGLESSEQNNLQVKNTVSVYDATKEFTTKINSRLDFTQKAYYATTNGIENEGPVPPEAGEATTYAVVWELKNYLNDLKNIKVKMILPKNVSIADAIFPEDEALNFSFDSKSREIVWLIGSLSADESASLTFQIALTPDASQKGKTAALVGQATVTGEDQFTDSLSQDTAPAINSSLPDDKEHSEGGIVQ